MAIPTSRPDLWLSRDIDPSSRQSWKVFQTAPPGSELLYRLYDADMRLLYVGITWNPFVRWTEHSKTKPWWVSVAFADVDLHRTNRDARDWETWCIKNQSPLHNKHQNGGTRK